MHVNFTMDGFRTLAPPIILEQFTNEDQLVCDLGAVASRRMERCSGPWEESGYGFSGGAGPDPKENAAGNFLGFTEFDDRQCVGLDGVALEDRGPYAR